MKYQGPKWCPQIGNYKEHGQRLETRYIDDPRKKDEEGKFGEYKIQ